MGARRKGREYALQILYLADLTKLDIEKATRSVLYGTNAEKPTADFAELLARGTHSYKESLDVLIQKHAKNWEIERMAALDRNLLRMSAYELLHEPQTPVSVIIDEAVEIAKMFSSEDSGKFVNGILDQIKNERKVGTVEKN